MRCADARNSVALAQGHEESDAALAAEVCSHLSTCRNCRDFQRSLTDSQRVLLEARVEPRRSCRVWPTVARRLADWEAARPQFPRFNFLVPTVAAAMACLVLVSVASLEVRRHTPDWGPSMVTDRAPQTRDLFRTDPDFTTSRGKLVSEEDVRRWQRVQGGMLQPASNIPQW